MSTLFSFPGVRVSGIGYELGEDLITNEAVSEIVNSNVRKALGREPTADEAEKYLTNPEWITERTGIEERYFARPETATSDLAAKAVLKAIEMSGRSVQDCEFILVATVTPDYLYSPSVAPLVQRKIGFKPRTGSKLNKMRGCDVSLACTSFMEALSIGHSHIASGKHKFGVVVGADKMSTAVNPADRTFFPLLGDAAAAMTLEAVPAEENAFLPGGQSFFPFLDGEGWDKIIARAGGSRNPLNFGIMGEMIDNPLVRLDKLWQDGPTVLKEIGNLVFSHSKPEETVIGCALMEAGIELSELDFIFLHQASGRIIKPIERRIRAAPFFRGNVFNTFQRFGNTTSASIPLGIATAYLEGKIEKGDKIKLKKGDKILVCAFGGGYTAGTAIFKWTI